jgi:hypothetical protein
MNTKNLRQLLGAFQAAKRTASEASSQVGGIHRTAQELTHQLSGRLVPASVADVPGQLDAFMRQAKAGGNWFNQAMALREEMITAQAAARKAREAAGRAEAALEQEVKRFNDERLQALQSERANAVKRLVKFLLPYCAGQEAKAAEMACQCPKVICLDFEISNAAVPLAAELMAGRFLSVNH